MNRTIKEISDFVATIAFAVFVLMLCALAYKAAGVLDSVHSAAIFFGGSTTDASVGALNEIRDSVKLSREHLDRDLTEIGLTAASLRKMAKEGEKASVEQRAYWAKSSQEIETTIASLNDAIKHTDEGLNNYVLPDADAVLKESRDVGRALEKSINETNTELKPVLENAAATIGNPDIAESLKRIDESTKNIEAATANVKEGTALAVEYEKKALAPASLAKRVLFGAAGVVGRLIGW